MHLKKLEWDSDFFGFGVARLDYSNELNLEESLKNSLQNPHHLVYVFSPDPIKEKQNLTTLDTMGVKLIFKKKLVSKSVKLHSNIVSYPNEIVSEKLLDLAYQSGIYSRFKLDPKMPKGSFEKLYQLWIKGSVERSIAKEVYVYKVGAEIAGMLTLGIKNGHGNIGLIAVDAKFRGQKIGANLLEAADYFCIKEGLGYLDVATQKENQPAVGFYHKNGFKIVKEEYIYHYWKAKKYDTL